MGQRKRARLHRRRDGQARSRWLRDGDEQRDDLLELVAIIDEGQIGAAADTVFDELTTDREPGDDRDLDAWTDRANVASTMRPVVPRHVHIDDGVLDLDLPEDRQDLVCAAGRVHFKSV